MARALCGQSLSDVTAFGGLQLDRTRCESAIYDAIIIEGSMPWKEPGFPGIVSAIQRNPEITIVWLNQKKIPAKSDGPTLLVLKDAWKRIVAQHVVFDGKKESVSKALDRIQTMYRNRVLPVWIQNMVMWTRVLNLTKHALTEFHNAHARLFAGVPRYCPSASDQDKRAWLKTICRLDSNAMSVKIYVEGAMLVDPSLIQLILDEHLEDTLTQGLLWCLNEVWCWAQTHSDQLFLQDVPPFQMDVVGLERRQYKNWPRLVEQDQPLSRWINSRFFPAVDGLVLKEHTHLIPRNVPHPTPENPKTLNFGSIGCFLSHRQLWKIPIGFDEKDVHTMSNDRTEMLKRQTGLCDDIVSMINDYTMEIHPYHLCAEDDKINGPMAQRDLKTLAWLLWRFMSTPERYSRFDTIWIGYHVERSQRWAAMSNLEPKIFLSMAQPNPHVIGGTFAYLVSPAGKQRWLELFESQPRITLGVDTWMMHHSREKQLVLNTPIFFSEYHNGTQVKSDCSY